MEILDALYRRDVTAAQELNEQHVETAWKFVEAHLKELEIPAEYDASTSTS